MPKLRWTRKGERAKHKQKKAKQKEKCEYKHKAEICYNHGRDRINFCISLQHNNFVWSLGGFYKV